MAWVAVLTPEALGAIAVVRVWGADALAVCDGLFRPLGGKRLVETRTGRARVGRMGAGIGDEVVAIVHPGVPTRVEIQCHGGAAAVTLVTECLFGAGCRAATAADYLRFEGHLRLEQEAWLDLSEARTLRVAAILLDQANGAFRREVEEAIAALGDRREEAAGLVGRLVDRGRVGLKLRGGWKVVLTGRPNVGKSRLLNAITGFERAIVAPTPGTTRDVVASSTAICGWPVELSDTAGLRVSGDEVESEGVRRAVEQSRVADLCLVVLDVSAPLEVEDEALLGRMPEALVVANKCDLDWAWEPGKWGAREVSALRGTGVESLVEEVGRRLVGSPPPVGAGVPFRAWQMRGLWRAWRLLERGEVSESRAELARLLARG